MNLLSERRNPRHPGSLIRREKGARRRRRDERARVVSPPTNRGRLDVFITTSSQVEIAGVLGSFRGPRSCSRRRCSSPPPHTPHAPPRWASAPRDESSQTRLGGRGSAGAAARGDEPRGRARRLARRRRAGRGLGRGTRGARSLDARIRLALAVSQERRRRGVPGSVHEHDQEAPLPRERPRRCASRRVGRTLNRAIARPPRTDPRSPRTRLRLLRRREKPRPSAPSLFLPPSSLSTQSPSPRRACGTATSPSRASSATTAA